MVVSSLSSLVLLSCSMIRFKVRVRLRKCCSATTFLRRSSYSCRRSKEIDTTRRITVILVVSAMVEFCFKRISHEWTRFLQGIRTTDYEWGTPNTWEL
ncbi:unnamed protein product [Victoria cruziana]